MPGDLGGDTPVSDWFGPAFGSLHPLLQALHRRGAMLSGPLTVTLGRGFAGWVGARLARRLGIPPPRPGNRMAVTIFSDGRGLHWNRCFNGSTTFCSVFTPVGSFPSGHWVERSGLLRLALSVDIDGGGWQWRTVKAWLGPVRLPLWLLPRTTAGKRIDGACYEFSVRLHWPILGTVLSYAGRLQAVTNDNDSVHSGRSMSS